MSMSGITPSQTVGPFFAYGLTPNGKYDWVDTFSNNLITPDASGERIRVRGRVFDADDKPIPDAMIEIWQADAQGRYANPADQRSLPNAKFTGFGRCGADDNGDYSFDTIKPGPVPGPNGKMQAPHIMLAIFARGMLRQSYTRIYFADEAANAGDPILALVPPDRRDTLIAKRDVANGQPVYTLDIHMQGAQETVFFEV
jgi:protocatechuate 3,4-dioxygenase alpha subunit